MKGGFFKDNVFIHNITVLLVSKRMLVHIFITFKIIFLLYYAPQEVNIICNKILNSDIFISITKTTEVILMLYVLGAVYLIVALFIFKKSGSFFKAFFTSAVGGVGALCAVSAVSLLVPLSVGLNWYSLAFSVFYSVPGVVFLLLSETFIF